MGVERTGGLSGIDSRYSFPGQPNRFMMDRERIAGRPAGAEHGSGSGIGRPPRKQYQEMMGMPQYNRSLWKSDTTGTWGAPMDMMYGSITDRRGNAQFPGATQSYLDRSNRSARRGGGGGFFGGGGGGGGGFPGIGGGGGGGNMGKITTPGGAEFYGNEMIDVMFDDFRVKKQMDPVMADLFKTQMDYEIGRLKLGSDERINQANIQGAMERAELEASLTRERNSLEDQWKTASDDLARYDIEQQMSRLEYQAGEARFQQKAQHEAEMSQLGVREAGETERSRIPFEYQERKRAEFMPILMSLLGGGGGFGGGGGGMGGGSWGGGMPREVGPNRDSNTPSFEGVLRRGVNDIVGNTVANRDAAMLGATAAQTGPEGGLGGGTTANYLGPLAQHSAVSGATGGINDLLQNLLQYNLGQRQAGAQTIGALAPYLT